LQCSSDDFHDARGKDQAHCSCLRCWRVYICGLRLGAGALDVRFQHEHGSAGSRIRCCIWYRHTRSEHMPYRGFMIEPQVFLSGLTNATEPGNSEEGVPWDKVCRTMPPRKRVVITMTLAKPKTSELARFGRRWRPLICDTVDNIISHQDSSEIL
jgi:hypothetical protein